MAITSSPLLAPDDVARHTFTTVRRGFDPKEVRSYLESLAHGLTSLAEREHELLEDLAATERRAQNPVLDEATLVAALGEQTARVLHSAHEVADEQLTKAKEEAERLVSDATDQAQAARASAESEATERMAAIEAGAERLVAEATERSSALIEVAQRDSDELRTRAKEQCRSMVDEAQQLRARVLADLATRRRLLHAQIEQLRAGRERLAETIDGVRRSVDGIAEDLFTAEDDAREAAEVAGRAAAARADDEPPDDLTELLRAVANATDVEIEVDVDAATDVEANDQEASASPEVEVTGRESDDPAAGPAPEGAAAPTGKVDALFAKLRAGHDGEELEKEGPGAAEAAPGPSAASGATDMPEAGPSGTTVDLEAGVDIGDDMADGAEENGSGPPADRPPAVVQRDELIAPVVTALSRRLKRTLQDTQNDMLDHLRSNGSQWSVAVLPEETEQVDGLTTAVLPVLEEAAEAGVSFAGDAQSATPSTDAIVDIAHGLAEEVVGPLRRRLSADGGVSEAGEAAAVEHVGAAFREWRGPRVERLAGDYVVAAFSLGSVTAVQRDRDGRLEWVSVPGSGDAPCPDCEDNGLAGPQPPGDEFPTGHRHPPAHSGCRCLVAPAAS
jgi:DivIVA domain-containing protein